MRNYCGHELPEGLRKNQQLASALVTPTTKDDNHDELISAEEIVRSGRMSAQDWERCRDYSLRLFAYSQALALSRGLILADTKYEFGREPVSGEIMMVDELQTPDSSRYWIESSYHERMAQGQVSTPTHIDKQTNI